MRGKKEVNQNEKYEHVYVSSRELKCLKCERATAHSVNVLKNK